MLVPEKQDWWQSKTMPFSTLQGEKPARFELRQVDDNEFRLLKPFKYVPPEGKEIPVTAELLGDTDLASIPSFLGWFARRHGRHTPAALMHDELITETPEKLPPELRMSPTEADLLFRQALRASEVPLVMSWVLWTGVTLLTRWRSRFPAKLAIIAWFAIAVLGTTLLVYGVRADRPGLVAIALLAPLPSAALWLPAWPAGLIAGYAFWIVVFGSAPGWLAYHGYRLVEAAVRLLGGLLGRLWPQQTRPELPPSPSFEER
jgi:hypothetical protein